MTQLSKNQVKFLNFAELAKFLNSINSDVDLSRQGPDFSVFSKTKGIVAGCNFEHLCALMNKTFDFGLKPKGCLQYVDGYLITFEDEVPTAKPQEVNLEEKNRSDLFKIAKSKGLNLHASTKKEDLISAIKSA